MKIRETSYLLKLISIIYKLNIIVGTFPEGVYLEMK